MASLPLMCNVCGATLPLSAEQVQAGVEIICSSCQAFQIQIFPAYFRPPQQGHPGSALIMNESAGCFYHEDKQAEVHCDGCGRFLCALCDIELADQHLCSACLDAGRRKGELQTLEKGKTLYDNIALALAVYPTLFLLITIVTAPAVIIFALRHWSDNLSVAPRTRSRFYAAIIIAALQLAAWISVLILLLD